MGEMPSGQLLGPPINRLDVSMRYFAAGNAMVMRHVSGVGRSGGRIAFNAPYVRTDGYDNAERIATLPWCTGAVGVDGHSYAGVTQLTAAAARPLSLRCMAPALPCTGFNPHGGGAIADQRVNRRAVLAIHHGGTTASCLHLGVVEDTHG